MRRSAIGALAFVLLALSTGASAQESAQYSLGRRDVGAVHDLSLTARNENCPQNLNFRFDFAPSPWLRPRGDNRVRGVPMGQSRPLPVIVDLTQMQPGQYTAEVDVSCENCEFLFIRNCGFDRQRLTLSVDAVAPALATATPVPAEPTAPPRRAAPEPAPTQNTSEPGPPPTVAPPPMTIAADSAPPLVEESCDCAYQTAPWQVAAGVLAALAGVGLLGWGMSAARAGRALADGARAPPDSPRPDIRQFLQDRAEEARELLNNERQNLIDLLQTQLQATRALAALGMIDRAAITPEAENWTTTARQAGYGVDVAKNAIVADRSSGDLASVIDAPHSAQQAGFAPFAASPDAARGDHAQRIAWLQQNGFARSEAEAQAVLTEISSYIAHGHSMGDMNERLQEQADECRRCDAELAMFIAQSAGG